MDKLPEVVDSRTLQHKELGALVAKHLRPDFQLFEGYDDVEVRETRSELNSVVKNLRRSTVAKSLDPTRLLDIIDLVGGDLFEMMHSELSVKYHRIAKQSLTKELLKRLILTFWAICTSGTRSADEFFENASRRGRWSFWANWVVTRSQYSAFMRALDEDTERQRGNGVNGINAQSLFMNEVLLRIGDGFGRLCREAQHLTFVLDDHQIPAAGKTDSHKKKWNEKKAANIGVVFDVAATSLLRIPVIISSPHGDVKPEAAFSTLLDNFIKNARYDRLKGTTWLLDRGYGSHRKLIIKHEGDYIATVKKGGNNEPGIPYTFDPPANTSKKLLEWMKIISGVGGPVQDACLVGPVVYVAYRPQPGRVVLMASTKTRFAYSWTFAPPRHSSSVISDTTAGPSVPKLDLDARSASDQVESDNDGDEVGRGHDDTEDESDGEDPDNGDESFADDSAVGGSSDSEGDESEAEMDQEGEDVGVEHEEMDEMEYNPQEGFSQLMSAEPLSYGILRLDELRNSDKGDKDVYVGEACRLRMDEKSEAFKEVTTEQTSPAWFCARTGVASSTAVREILAVDARSLIQGRLLGVNTANSLAGPIIRPVNILAGVSAVGDVQHVVEEDAEHWNSIIGSVEGVQYLKEYCSANRSYLDRLHGMFNHKTAPSKNELPFCGSLAACTREQLLSAAKVFGIAVSSKQITIQELLPLVEAGRKKVANKGCDLVPALIDGVWGFRSLPGTDAMKSGRIVESVVRCQLPEFVRKIGGALNTAGKPNEFAYCSEVTEMGLLESSSHPYAVTSPDGSLYVSCEHSPKDPNRLTHLVWENKALFSENTFAEVNRLTEMFGCYSHVEFHNNDSMDELHAKVAHFGNRKSELIQVMHHAAVTGAEVLYTLADGLDGEFLRMVRVSFDEEWRMMHLDTIQKIMCHHVPSTFDETIMVRVGECKSRVHSRELSNVLCMRRALRSAGADQSSGRFLPLFARIWNRTKSAVDAQSKDVINLRIRVGGNIRRKLICEGLLFLLVGCVRLYRANKIRDSAQGMTSRDEIIRSMSLVGSTQTIIRDALDIYTDEVSRKESAHPVPGSIVDIFRTPAPSTEHYRPLERAWEAEAKRLLDNVASTSSGKAEAFTNGILREIRVNETGGSWHVHSVNDLERSCREYCVLCCMNCSRVWKSMSPETVRGSTTEEIKQLLTDSHSGCSRRGFKVSTRCGVCRVTLCRLPRPELFGQGMSCWDVWHSVRNLNLQHPIFQQELSSAKSGNVTSAVSVPSAQLELTSSARKRRCKASGSQNYHGSSSRVNLSHDTSSCKRRKRHGSKAS